MSGNANYTSPSLGKGCVETFIHNIYQYCHDCVATTVDVWKQNSPTENSVSVPVWACTENTETAMVLTIQSALYDILPEYTEWNPNCTTYAQRIQIARNSHASYNTGRHRISDMEASLPTSNPASYSESRIHLYLPLGKEIVTSMGETYADQDLSITQRIASKYFRCDQQAIRETRSQTHRSNFLVMFQNCGLTRGFKSSTILSVWSNCCARTVRSRRTWSEGVTFESNQIQEGHNR